MVVPAGRLGTSRIYVDCAAAGHSFRSVKRFIYNYTKFVSLMVVDTVNVKIRQPKHMCMKATDAIQEKLQSVFGYKAFREEQAAIIQSVLEKKNTFVLMPTGGGKSLCYQIPALMQPGLTIVISPLIALMKNQVDQLRALGVDAAFLNSTLSKKAINKIKEDISAQTLKLLYVAPESLVKEENLAFLRQANISFIAVDEAHCISDWGHDFRPEYRKMRAVLDEAFGVLPMIALTATATPKVQQDILGNLDIEKATIFKASFNRANLYYEVQPKQQVEKQIVRFIKTQPPGTAGIVYCQSRKKVEEIASLLNVNNIKAAPYHAGLEPNTRIKHQDAFLGKEVDVIVATIAFGMGIDKPDVRFVIHHDVPRSLEGYYQETGRAGRDGAPGTCLMYYSTEDAIKLEKLNKSKSVMEREKAQALLQATVSYALSGVCRRKQLLHYFGETYEAPCNNCDNCQQPTKTFEGKEWVKMVLTAIKDTQERFGADHIIRLLRGKLDPYITSHDHQVLAVFGQGKEKGEPFWQSVIYQVQLLGLVRKEMIPSSVLKLTEEGRKLLKKSVSVTLWEDRDYQASTAAMDAATAQKVQDDVLLKMLQGLRDKVAKDKSIPGFAVLRDVSLEEMALVYPTTLEELARINGLSVSKAQKFGSPFIALIKQYVEENDIVTSSDIVVKSSSDKVKNKIYIIRQVDRKVDLEEIAAARSMSMDDLIKEMEQICYSGTKLNIGYYIDTLLTLEQQDDIYDYFMQADTDRIKEAQEAFDGEFEEDELRLMRIKFFSEVAN